MINPRNNLFLYVAVLGFFIVAVLLALFAKSSNQFIGVILIICGFMSVMFSRQLTVAQHQLAEKPFIPDHWKDVRPLTFILWGTGVTIIGLLHLFVL